MLASCCHASSHDLQKTIMNCYSSSYMQVQRAMLLAASMAQGIPVSDNMFIARAAAQDLDRQALFCPFRGSLFL